ncbi:MAG: RNB domain-containing ribonuclease [Chloroflexota bacterium]|nr:RNB domain-containing ribonuclease [Chloroflexota bacterium]
MPDAKLTQGSLVLYKSRQAIVRQLGDRLELDTVKGPVRRIRPKDVVLLHPGPVKDLGELQTTDAGELVTAWGLLAGETTDLAELTELAFGEYTPATAWATWTWVADGLYFRGTPDLITANTAEDIENEKSRRDAEAARTQAWADFLDRTRQGAYLPEDSVFLQDVRELALGQQDKSRVLNALGKAQTQENAHALLLELGDWDYSINPHPQRLDMALSEPKAPLAALPEEDRIDLTHLPAFAIDDEGTQDPDDALSLEGNRLWVHIADVAALITPDSPADLEARNRGANLYLPEGTVHMLPRAVTESLALGLEPVSPALSFGLDVDAHGQVTGCEVVPSWVRVQRLSYREAETRLNEQPFKQLLTLARTSEARRRANGAVVIDLPEVKIQVRDGIVSIEPLLPLWSRMLVTEAMIMAGEAAALFSLERDIALPYTIQDPPNDELPEDTTLSGMYAQRRTLKRSHQSTIPGLHAGLGLDAYSRATSPLRRYLDLVVHQQLRAYLHGTTLLDVQSVMERMGIAEAASGSTRQAERLSRRHWTLVYLLQNPNWQGDGILVKKERLRGSVLIPELGWETRLHLRQDLPLNSTLNLAVREANLPALDAYFRIAVPDPKRR